MRGVGIGVAAGEDVSEDLREASCGEGVRGVEPDDEGVFASMLDWKEGEGGEVVEQSGFDGC